MTAHSFAILPNDTIYYLLEYVAMKDVLALQSACKHLYQVISPEDCPVWETLCSFFFPDAIASYHPEKTHKHILQRQWKIFTQHRCSKPNVHLLDINLLASAKHAYFFSGLCYAIYDTHIKIFDPKESSFPIKIEVSHVEDLEVHGARLFTLKQNKIEMRDLNTFEIKTHFDCGVATEEQAKVQTKVIFIIHRHLLVTSFRAGQDTWRIKIWDYENNVELSSLPLTKGKPTALQIKGQLVYVGLDNGMIEVLHMKNGLMQIAGTTLSGASIDKLFFSGNFLMSCSSESNTQLTIWNLKDGFLINKFTYQTKNAQSMQVHDGLVYTLVAGYLSYTIQIWDPITQCTHVIDPLVRLLDKEYPISDFDFHEGMFLCVVNNQKLKVLDYTGNASSASCTLL